MDSNLIDRINEDLTYLESTGRYRFEFDAERLDPSVAIVATVGAVTDQAPEDVEPPLMDIIDPDAIDELFASRADGESPEESAVVFYLGGSRVHLFADDRVEVVPPEEG